LSRSKTPIEHISSQKEMPKCIYYKKDRCYANSCVPLFSQCSICHKRIEDLKNFIITNRFNSERYRLNQIFYELLEREVVTIDDLFPNPFYNCLRTIRYLDPEKKDKVMFNVFNVSQKEYYFEIFELALKELPEFIWYLEEFGYSEQLLSRFKDKIIEINQET
jgi:hypothetical protein